MKYHPCPIPGVFLVELEPYADQRGFFARTFCREDFAAHGLAFEPAQCNLSFNHKKGTLRGLHYQARPHAEAKLVLAVRGTVYDVAADLRPDSPTFGRTFGAELSLENRLAMYLPKNCAHGYLTLTDEAEVFYLVDQPYSPQSGRGLRWNDPGLAIDWPFAPAVISEQDRSWPDFVFKRSR